jgi:hypothetical protein
MFTKPLGKEPFQRHRASDLTLHFSFIFIFGPTDKIETFLAVAVGGCSWVCKLNRLNKMKIMLVYAI